MMPTPPLVKQLRQKRKKLKKQFGDFENIMIFERMATPLPNPQHLPTGQFKNFTLLDEMENTLREMLILIDQMKRS